MVGEQNGDIADNLQLRDVATATICWLSMDYNFGYIIATRCLILWGQILSIPLT